MTLNITLLSERMIYQSADFRLTDADTGGLVSENSTKLITLQYFGWNGFLSYTGVGQWSNRDTSEAVVDWLTGLHDATPDDVIARISDRGNLWLDDIEAVGRRGRPRHTFILAAFELGKPRLALISNFEDLYGRNDSVAASTLTVSTRRFLGKSQLVVTGCRSAVSRTARRRINHLVRDVSDEPARVRRVLAEANAQAAGSAAARGMISPACSVVSFRADGQGVGDISGPVSIRSILGGTSLPNREELTRMLGFDTGQFVGGMTFASSGPRLRYEPCRPGVATPEDSGGYLLHEASHRDFNSCMALDVSDSGVVLGCGTMKDQPGTWVMWTTPLDGAPTSCGFYGQRGGINDPGEVAAEANSDDGHVHAVLWRQGALLDLGCYGGLDSFAVTINDAGLVAGWVCVDPVHRGQINNRPAAWLGGTTYVLEDFDCDWGQAVDVNEAGLVAVVGYTRDVCQALVWNPRERRHEAIGGRACIHPTAIRADGTVLGTSRDREGRSVAYLAMPGGLWQQLEVAPGFYATAMNDRGDIVGATLRDGFERPWLRRASGEIVWLPYYDHHWCRPRAVNNEGVVVGTAQTDHGWHSLLWIPQGPEEPVDSPSTINS